MQTVSKINKSHRMVAKSQKPLVIWLTGISGAGKSSIADLIEQRLFSFGKHTYLLDGDNLRCGLNNDLSFSDAGRAENIRRVSEVAKLMVDAGLIVITAFISPFSSERNLARKLFDEGEFIEVFVNTPLEIAERRDVKGLYKKARRGEIKNFTGIDSPYEIPIAPELDLVTEGRSAEECADIVIEYLKLNSHIC